MRFVLMLFVFQSQIVYADSVRCQGVHLVAESGAPRKGGTSSVLAWLRKKAIDKTLDAMAIYSGLPKYLKRIEALKQKDVNGRPRYLNEYRNFGEMALAEMGISVRYNQAMSESLNTGDGVIVVANHHLGIADGSAVQNLVSRSRRGPSLLFLARWIEKLLPFAIYGDAYNWGTAIPVEINLPKKSDPDYEAKMKEVTAFNSSWNKKAVRVLKNGGALIVFPLGHVAAINENAGKYPGNVFDSPNSWQDGFLSLAHLGKAKIVFAHVDSVNSEAFYRNRKRFGGGDKERIVWFFSEALAKRGQNIDVYLSRPMSLDEIYIALSQKYGHSEETLRGDSRLTAELMRQFTYQVSETFPQDLDTKDSPQPAR